MRAHCTHRLDKHRQIQSTQSIEAAMCHRQTAIIQSTQYVTADGNTDTPTNHIHVTTATAFIHTDVTWPKHDNTVERKNKLCTTWQHSKHIILCSHHLPLWTQVTLTLHYTGMDGYPQTLSKSTDCLAKLSSHHSPLHMLKTVLSDK